MKTIANKAFAALVSCALAISILGTAPMNTYAAPKKNVQSVEITKPDSEVLVLKKGKTFKLKAKVTPANAKNKKLTYKTSKKSIATINKKGVIKAKKKGSVQITVQSKQKKNKKDTLKVIVGAPITSLAIEQSITTLKVGDTLRLSCSITPSNASYGILTWSSSDTSIASISADGTISALAAGTVTIYAKSEDGTNKQASCSFTIEEKAATPIPEPKPEPTPTPEPEITMKPIAELLADTNLDTPYGYTIMDNSVDYGKVETISYYSTATNSTRKAKVLLPANYTENKKYPVLYMMHGIGGTEESLLQIDRIEHVIGNTIASGDAEEMIVVFPNGCANETGLPPVGEDFYSLAHYAAYDNFINDLKDALMPYMEENFSIATGRENTAIAGFSMGGRVALHVGFSLPEHFRYIGALCPAFGILEYTNNGVYETGLFTEETFTLDSNYIDDTLVLIVGGKNDGIVRGEPKRYHEALEANDVPHIFYETLGGENYTGDGGHSADVYRHGLYNLMRRMFKTN